MSITVKNAIKNFKDEKLKITQSRELSPEGKAIAEKRLQINVDNYRGIALATLKSDMEQYRRIYSEIGQERKQAEDNAANNWDFKKLQYYSEVVKAKIATAQAEHNPAAGKNAVKMIGEAYQAAQNDKHLARAWSELGSAALYEKYPDNHEAIRLAESMSKDLDQLLTTPEIKAVNVKGSKLVDEMVDFVDTVKMAGEFFDMEHSEHIFSAPGDFGKIISDVRVTTTYTPNDPEHFSLTKLEIVKDDNT